MSEKKNISVNMTIMWKNFISEIQDITTSSVTFFNTSPCYFHQADALYKKWTKNFKNSTINGVQIKGSHEMGWIRKNPNEKQQQQTSVADPVAGSRDRPDLTLPVVTCRCGGF